MQVANAKRTLTKGELCVIFGIYSRSSGKPYYHRLRELYFTEKALEEMDISLEEYRQTNAAFTFDQTKRIIEYFDIKPEEIPE